MRTSSRHRAKRPARTLRERLAAALRPGPRRPPACRHCGVQTLPSDPGPDLCRDCADGGPP